MRTLLLGLLLLPTLIASAQSRTYTPAELKRLESLGRLWGAVHYFHPAMGSGRIATDSLIVHNAEALAADPSAARFRTVAADLLSRLGDPATRLYEAAHTPAPLLQQAPPGQPATRRYADGTWWVSFPTALAGSEAVLGAFNPMAWDSAKTIVFDLRNRPLKSIDMEFGDMVFQYELMPVLRARIAGSQPLPEVYSRRVYHQGFVNQSDGTANVYSSGWRTVTKGRPEARPELAGIPHLQAPVVVILNQYNTSALVEAWLQLQAAGRCTVVYEGNAAPAGEVIPLALADGLEARIRVTESFVGDALMPPPALTVARIDNFDENGPFLTALRAALAKGPAAGGAGTPPTQRYVLPRPGAYAASMRNPTVGQRLFGLYNYWNAIRYFYPYAHLLPEDWDGQLLKLLPTFLAAEGGRPYQLAILKAVSTLHDSHGFVRNVNGATPNRDSLGYWPPVMPAFIGDKCYIIDIGKDSTQDLSGLQPWDELIAIDGVPLLQYARRFRDLLATSNEATFRRDLGPYIINGPLGSKVRLLLRRNGKEFTTTLTRSGRDEGPNKKRIDFNDDHPVLQLLPGNIGYVNLGALDMNQVDSMFAMMRHTRAIIFDMRNYPRGTAWKIGPRLARRDTVAVRFEVPFVDYFHLTGGEDKLMATSAFTVQADTTQPKYGGKVVVLCNAVTQSQAEYSIMILQAAAKATVIGSQTAGADGNVTDIVWPGGYRTSFSGSAILYPDRRQTQRTGIRIDIPASPTLEGLKAGKDEVLERAIRFVQTGK